MKTKEELKTKEVGFRIGYKVCEEDVLELIDKLFPCWQLEKLKSWIKDKN